MELNDIVTKNFESYADVAADIVNALLHEGTVVVTGDEMLTAATESLYADSTNTLHNQLEDVAKYHVTNGMPRALYLFANQMKVLYWATARWKASSNLRQLIDGSKSKIAETTWKYVDDMQLHVWEMRYLPKEIRERFHSDMRIVLDYLAEGNAYRSDQKIIHKEATIKILRVLSGDKNVDDTEEILKALDIAEEDEISMCELFDQYTRRGISQGISQGISKGIIIMCKDFNATYEYTLQKLKNKLNISEKEAEEQMKLYW